MNTYFPTPLDSECLKVFSYKQTNMFFLINLCPLKNNKSRPKGRLVVFGRGRKIIFAPLRSLHSFAIAHRRTPVRLSLVVELSCRVQIFAPLKNNKSRPKGRLVVFGSLNLVLFELLITTILMQLHQLLLNLKGF
jgi:hypothetical protein